MERWLIWQLQSSTWRDDELIFETMISGSTPFWTLKLHHIPSNKQQNQTMHTSTLKHCTIISSARYFEVFCHSWNILFSQIGLPMKTGDSDPYVNSLQNQITYLKGEIKQKKKWYHENILESKQFFNADINSPLQQKNCYQLKKTNRLPTYISFKYPKR